MQYLVIKHDFAAGKSTTIGEYNLRLEAMDKIENVVFDFILQKEGDYALAPKNVTDDKVTAASSNDAEVVKGAISREVPTCLFREYSAGSSNWNRVPDGYVVVRNPRESLNRLTVLKKTTIPGWLTNDYRLEKVFYVDIVEYQYYVADEMFEPPLVNAELLGRLITTLKENELFQALGQLRENQ